MAQTINFKTKQELDQYLAQNPQIKGTIQGFGMDGQKIAPQKDFISSLVGGIVDPFLGLGQKTLEAGASIGAGLSGKAGLDKFLTGSKEYNPFFMNSEEYGNFAKNPFLSTVKDVAGVGATFVPIGKVGQGIGALAKSSALASGLSSFANQDKENTGNINLGQIGTDALLGGALGGGIGVLQKGLNFGGKASKLGQNLETAGTKVKANNLGFKPSSFADDTAQKVVGQLDEAGLPITGANAEKLANQNSSAFRDVLKTKSPIDFGAKPTNNLTSNLQDLSQELDNTVVNSLTTQKNLRPSVIKSQLANDPLSSDLAGQISGLEDIIKETRPPAQFNNKLKQVISAIDSKTNVGNKVANVDNLASDLFNSLPGGQAYLQKLDDGFSPEDVIQEFLTDRNKLKTQLNNTYETAHQNLIKANPDYAKKYGQTAETLSIPSQGQSQSANTIYQGIADKLATKEFGLGQNVLGGSKALQNAIKDNVDQILATNGDPNKIMDIIGSLTVPKNIAGQAQSVTNANKVIEGTRQYLKEQLETVAPEASQFFQTNAPLRAVQKDALKASQGADKVPILTNFGGLEIPGFGAVKSTATNATGGALQGIGKFLQNGIGGVGNISNIANGRAGQALQRGLPFAIGSQAFNQPQQAGIEQATTDTSQVQTGQVANLAQDPEVRALLQQLMTPTKQGGQGLSPSEAEKYMKIAYGIDVGGSGGSAPAKRQTGQAKSSLENLDQIGALLKKDPSILQKSVLPEFLQDANTKSFKNLVDATAENYGRLQSGGAINEKEEKRFNNQIYSVFASPESSQQKVEIMKKLIAEYL